MPPKTISSTAASAVSSTPSTTPWQLILCTLLNCSPSDISIEENEQSLHFTLPSMLKANLEQILKSPAAIRAGIHYKLTSSSVAHAPSSTTPLIDTPLAPPAEKAPQILQHLFGDLLSPCGLHREKLVVKNGYLVIPIQEKFLEIRREAVKLLQQALKNATFQQLRNAFLEISNETLEISDSIPGGILVEQADKIIGIHYNAAEAEIYFDYNLLFQLVFPPSFEPCPTEETQDGVSISINKRHLVAYLSTVFNEGFLLYRESESTARPICLSSSRTILQPISFKIILDCSGSLRSTWESYIFNIKAFINKLIMLAPHATIQFFAFSDICMPSTIFFPDSQAAILDYLTSLRADGNTRLYGSLAKALETTPSSLTDDAILVLFTDGKDSFNCSAEKGLVSKHAQAFQAEPNPPKIFTFGFGDSLNEEVMHSLSEVTGATYSRLTDQADFKQVLDLTQTMCTKRTLIHFIQTLSAQVTRFTVPAYEGRPNVASHTIALDAPVQVNGTQYNVMSQHPSLPANRVVQRVQATNDTLGDSISELDMVNLISSNTAASVQATQVSSGQPSVSVTEGGFSLFRAGREAVSAINEVCTLQ